ncbi:MULTISPECIES: DUF2510 domain-containing protein [unclassified Streptomyces]|uniref:DUF2510 domain-containing protein n=1 Tax=unclassified Streptomyces TaxID=2593676 RepID=UPI003D72FD79
MTQVTPPGWYPDPGQTSDGPASERWWDGKAWTDRTRPAGSAAAWGPPGGAPAAGAQTGFAAHPTVPAFPAHPALPAPPGAPAARRGVRTGIAVAAAVAVLASIGIGVYTLTKDDGGDGRPGTAQGDGGRGGPFGGPGGGDGGGDRDGGRGSGGPGDSDEDSPSPRESEAPKIRSGSVTDALNGISIPIPKGWTGQQSGAGAQVMSDTTYPCPGAADKTCVKGGVYSAPRELHRTKGGTPEEVAKADIAANAEESYGGSTYGSITSHQVLASQAVTVAGQKGYLVRWKAITGKGVDGYVESLVFPAPAEPSRLVVLRFGLDADQQVSVIDTITKGIAVAKGGGTGRDV